MPDTNADDTGFYMIYLDGADDVGAISDDSGILKLDDNLFLAKWDESLSRLYHAVKRRTRPDTLLVAPLDGPPKFKGMAEGSLKWVRAQNWA